jgi:hypothetical protein
MRLKFLRNLDYQKKMCKNYFSGIEDIQPAFMTKENLSDY